MANWQLRFTSGIPSGLQNILLFLIYSFNLQSIFDHVVVEEIQRENADGIVYDIMGVSIHVQATLLKIMGLENEIVF